MNAKTSMSTPTAHEADVPARLDAAATALDACGAEWGTTADYLRMTADDLRYREDPEVYAAVAAALLAP